MSMSDPRISTTEIERWRVINANCIDALKTLPRQSVDAVVTDPPYEFHLMGKDWDQSGVSFNPETWKAALRVLKPGAHMLVFGGTRTFHRIACAVEDARFELRDTLCWLYAQGYPKSLAALKPAWEPIIVARKPLSEKTVTANILKHGTGGLNIDACRIGRNAGDRYEYGVNGDEPSAPTKNVYGERGRKGYEAHAIGRWPANLVLDEEAARLVDEQAGDRPAGGHPRRRGPDGQRNTYGRFNGGANRRIGVQNTTGGASRFFYVAKASKSDRGSSNDHPAVKPTALMMWLCTLVTAPGGLVLDPFAGSGTTGVACISTGHRFIGIEIDPGYCRIARRRIAEAIRNKEA